MITHLLGFLLLGLIALAFTFTECLVYGFSWRAWRTGLLIVLSAISLASLLVLGIVLISKP